MPKRKIEQPPHEQSEKFEALVKKLVADGELSRTDADNALDNLVGNMKVDPKAEPD